MGAELEIELTLYLLDPYVTANAECQELQFRTLQGAHIWTVAKIF